MPSSSRALPLSPEWLRTRLELQKQQNERTSKLARFEDAAGYYRIRTKSDGLVTFDYSRWHEEQKRFNRERTGRDIIVKARQLGFTTLELARSYWQATTREAQNAVTVGHDRELVEKLLETVKLFHLSMADRGMGAATKYDNARTLAFRDLVSSISVTEAGDTERVAAKKGRSATITRLHATELAFWSEPSATMKGLLGAVPNDGEVVCESSPNGAGGYFYNLVQENMDGKGSYKVHFFPWHEHVHYRMPNAFLNGSAAPRDEWEERLRKLGCDDQQIAWWRLQVERLGIEGALQEYPIDLETCFRTSGKQYLDPPVLDSAAKFVTAPVRTLTFRGFDVRVYTNPVPGREYVIGADVAEGIGNDTSALTVLDKKTGHTVAAGSSPHIQPGDFGLVLVDVARVYNQALVAPERNNHGAATLRAIEAEARYGRVYTHGDGRPGWPTTGATRPPLFEELRMAVRDGSAHTPDAPTFAEMRTLVIDADGKPRAKNKTSPDGSKDDLWLSWAIAWQVRGRPVKLDALESGKQRMTAGLGKFF